MFVHRFDVASSGFQIRRQEYRIRYHRHRFELIDRHPRGYAYTTPASEWRTLSTRRHPRMRCPAIKNVGTTTRCHHVRHPSDGLPILTFVSKETIASIVREAKILHVAFVDGDGMPQCIPMIGALEDDAVGDHILYLHGWCKQPYAQ